MLSRIIAGLMRELLKALPSDVLKDAVDVFLDKIEEIIEKTPNKIDDAAILPVIKLIRETFDIDAN